MTSVKTQIPYEYYSLKFCRPAGGVHYRSENLGKYGLFSGTGLPTVTSGSVLYSCVAICALSVGEVLRGDRISNTPYVVSCMLFSIFAVGDFAFNFVCERFTSLLEAVWCFHLT